MRLVEQAIKVKGEANRVWCVFDVDNTDKEGILTNALKLAKKNEVRVALSNIAFEVWLISHYVKPEKEMDVKQCILKLNDILKENNCKQEYDKTDDEQLTKYFIPRYKTAINNSKVIHQTMLSNGQKEIRTCNPCTNVYELIEDLKLQGKTF